MNIGEEREFTFVTGFVAVFFNGFLIIVLIVLCKHDQVFIKVWLGWLHNRTAPILFVCKTENVVIVVIVFQHFSRPEFLLAHQFISLRCIGHKSCKITSVIIAAVMPHEGTLRVKADVRRWRNNRTVIIAFVLFFLHNKRVNLIHLSFLYILILFWRYQVLCLQRLQWLFGREANLLFGLEFRLADIILDVLIQYEGLALVSFEGDSAGFGRYFATNIVENQVFIQGVLVFRLVTISIFTLQKIDVVVLLTGHPSTTESALLVLLFSFVLQQPVHVWLNNLNYYIGQSRTQFNLIVFTCSSIGINYPEIMNSNGMVQSRNMLQMKGLLKQRQLTELQSSKNTNEDFEFICVNHAKQRQSTCIIQSNQSQPYLIMNNKKLYISSQTQQNLQYLLWSSQLNISRNSFLSQKYPLIPLYSNWQFLHPIIVSTLKIIIDIISTHTNPSKNISLFLLLTSFFWFDFGKYPSNNRVGIPYWNKYLFSMRLRVTTNRYFGCISEFSFIKQIGVGSFGTVQLALHIPTNKCYAVKVNIGAVTESQMLLLERQINLHTAVDHPHIIKLWDTLIEEDTVYMIMELAENGTLFAYQSKNPAISQAEVFKFFSQTLSAIRYMHTKDIMHRDIKPQNILLDNANNVKICDLGWATDNIYMKRKTFCGTYEYMAPEMVFQQEYNFTIDIWALGILLYELLHRHAPFTAKNLDQMKEKVKIGFYELASTLSNQLKNLIVQILQFDSKKRPKISQIIAHPWMQIVRRQIQAEAGKIKNQLEGQISTRAKVTRDKGSMVTKKHNRFDSLFNENLANKNDKYEFINTVDKLITEEGRKAKKKCKTQGEEIIQKLMVESAKMTSIKTKPLKRQKQNNSQAKLIADHSYAVIPSKADSLFSTVKMKRIADKLNQITSKCPLVDGRKKGRGKLQREEGF